MYKVIIDEKLKKIFIKLKKKSQKQFLIIRKKVQEIKINPHRYKNLRVPLSNLKRVHIDAHFVLTFSINEKNKTITLEDYEHHKMIYK